MSATPRDKISSNFLLDDEYPKFLSHRSFPQFGFYFYQLIGPQIPV